MRGGLLPLGSGGGPEARLRRAWPLLVGPALLRHTRILGVRGRILVLGCFELSLVPGMRRAAEGAWPELRERIRRATRLDLHTLEVVPCDPPPPAAEREPEADALDAVLRWYRDRGHAGDGSPRGKP